VNTIPEIIEDIRQGKMVIMVDDEDRENEGDIVLAGDAVTPEAINFMAREARGLICLALAAEQISKLGVPLMVKDEWNRSPNRTAFTVSIEASQGISTGISAADRAHTIRVASSETVQSSDIITPGHVFPIRAQVGGVLKRAGHTEASVDLATLSGRRPAAVICEIMNEDGTMARVPQLKEFAKKHKIKIGTIVDLIRYRSQNEMFVEQTALAPFQSSFGDFEVRVFLNKLDQREHIAISKGDLHSGEPVLVRVQVESVFGDALGGLQNTYLQQALETINEVGRGVLVYLRKDWQSPHLTRIIENMAAKTPPSATRRPVMDERDYGIGAQILRSLGLEKIVLLTNHQVKLVGIKGYGLEVIGNIPLKKTLDDGFDMQMFSEILGGPQ
jgi:3,4-dihydroxy 2-butanone 4-phosphate synthase/GTP cyclohydrolase II